MAEAPAVSSAQAVSAPAADVAPPVEKPTATTDNTNSVTEAKFEPTEDVVKSGAAPEPATGTSTNGKPNADEGGAAKDADAAMGDAGKNSAPIPEATGDAPKEAKAPEAAKDKENEPSTAEAISEAAQPVEASAGLATTNGAASSDKDAKAGDKRSAGTVEADASADATAATTNNGAVSKAKAAVKKAVEPLAKKVKTDKSDKGDADVTMADADPVAKPVENGTNGLKRTKSTKRDKKPAVPVGRTERKTRSQGPI